MTTLYFYKGTPFGQWEKQLSYKTAMAGGKAQIELGLRVTKMSLEEQSAFYFQQLDCMEAGFCRHARNGEITRKTIVKVAKEMDLSVDKLYSIWCINICSLLIMKKIKDDDMNGIMHMSMSKTR
jgi:hypothetical protein